MNNGGSGASTGDYRGLGAIGILGQAFRLYGRGYGTMIPLSLLFGFLPGVLTNLILFQAAPFDFNAFLQSYMQIFTGNMGDYMALIESLEVADMLRWAAISWSTSAVTAIFITPLYTGGLTISAMRGYAGTRPELGSVLRATATKYGRLIVLMLCQIVFGLAIGIAVGVVVGTLVALAALAGNGVLLLTMVLIWLLVLVLAIATIPMLVCVYPAALNENVWNFKAIMRSIKMGFKRFWPIIGALVLCSLGISAVLFVVQMPLSLLTSLGAMPQQISNVFVQIISSLFAPLTVGISVVAYYDIRIVNEGFIPPWVTEK